MYKYYRPLVFIFFTLLLVGPAIITPGMALSAIGATETTPLHWEDCFNAAMNRSETIADQDQLIFQANEKHKQVIGTMLPTISGSASRKNLNAPTLSASPVQDTAALTATQPLFQGFRDYAGLRQTNDTIAATEQTKKRTVVQLYQSVTAAFYQVLAAEKDMDNLESEEKLYDKQIDQLQKWLKIGRSRSADVAQTQSQRAQLLATLEASKNQANTARETLAYLTGLNRNLVIEDSFPARFEVKLGPIDSYIAAIERRPEIQASQFNQNAAAEGVTIAKAGHLPTVNLVGDYYALRTGISSTNNGMGSWDVLVGVNIPIFSGGIVQSQVNVAASQEFENELFLSQNKRLAHQEIQTYYNRVNIDENQVKSLAAAKNLAWQSYQQQLRDYSQSMATNIDVLQSLTTFISTERSLDQIRYQKRIDYLYLLAATGKTKQIPY